MAASSTPTLQRPPKTRFGAVALILAVAYLGLYVLSLVLLRLDLNPTLRQDVLPYFGILMIVCGLAAGVFGLVALLKGHESSRRVWLSIAVGALALLFALGQLFLSGVQP